MVESLQFGGAVVANLAGPWSLRIQDPYATYLYDAVFKPLGPQKWQVEETLRETGYPFHRTRIGQTKYDCQAGLEGQKVVMVCDGFDPNPSAQGRLPPGYEGIIDAQGVVRGNGRHQGVLNSNLSWEMRRVEGLQITRDVKSWYGVGVRLSG